MGYLIVCQQQQLLHWASASQNWKIAMHTDKYQVIQPVKVNAWLLRTKVSSPGLILLGSHRGHLDHRKLLHRHGHYRGQ